MRLDKFLQVSRIVKRRTVANAVCSSGKILVNGQRAKAGKELAVGDVLTVTFREDSEQVLEIVEIPSGNVSMFHETGAYPLPRSPIKTPMHLHSTELRVGMRTCRGVELSWLVHRFWQDRKNSTLPIYGGGEARIERGNSSGHTNLF